MFATRKLYEDAPRADIRNKRKLIRAACRGVTHIPDATATRAFPPGQGQALPRATRQVVGDWSLRDPRETLRDKRRWLLPRSCKILHGGAQATGASFVPLWGSKSPMADSRKPGCPPWEGGRNSHQRRYLDLPASASGPHLPRKKRGAFRGRGACAGEQSLGDRKTPPRKGGAIRTCSIVRLLPRVRHAFG